VYTRTHSIRQGSSHLSGTRTVLYARHTAYDQVIEGSDGVGLRPQADLARTIARVPVIQEERTIQIGLDVIPDRDDPYRMPLAKHWRPHAHGGKLAASA